MNSKFILFFFVITMKKSWTGSKEDLAVIDGMKTDVHYQLINDNEGVRNDSNVNQPKNNIVPSVKNIHKVGHHSEKQRLNLNSSEGSISSIEEDKGNADSLRSLRNMYNFNSSLFEEIGVSYDDKNASFQSEFGNNNNPLQDDGVTFDWRRREDTYEKTDPAQYPYSVLLLIYSGKRNETSGLCTGSILSETWILTAAHCVHKANVAYVYAGGNSLRELKDHYKYNFPLPYTAQLRTSSKLIKHPKYHQSDSDVALVKLNKALNMTRYVNTVRLTTTPWADRYHTYTTCVLTGFGIIQMGETRGDDHYRKTHHLEVKSPCLCFFRLKILFGKKVASRYICTKPKLDYGVCPGDSGGGMVCGGVVRGITMQIIKLENTKFCDMSLLAPMKCGGRNTLSIFQDVCPYLPWINKHTELLNSSDISKKCEYVGNSPPVRSSKLLLLFSFLAIGAINLFIL